MTSLSPELLAASVDAYDRKMRPLAYVALNRAQRGAALCDKSTLLVEGPNRTGKSFFGYWLCASVAQGKNPNKNLFRVGTRLNPVKIRYVSTPENFTDEVQPGLKRLFPPGAIIESSKDSQNGYYRRWVTCVDGVYAKITFLSVDQDVKKFESTAADLIIADEPMTEDQYYACVTRIGADNDTGPVMVFVMTPLDSADWMTNELFDQDNEPKEWVGYHPLTVEDNIMCMLPDQHDGDSRYPLNDNGRCTCNGGYLHKKAVEEEDKRISNPWERWTRIEGKRLGNVRRIFPMFKTDIHVVKNNVLPGWRLGRPPIGTLWITMDPHDAKADFAQFWVADPTGWLIQVDELPNYWEGRYAGVEFEYTRSIPIPESAQLVADVVKRLDLKIGGCCMDPHFSNKTYRDQQERFVDLFNKAFTKLIPGSSFIVVQMEKDDNKELIVGHKKISERLAYNPEEKIERGNAPSMYWTENCYHSIRAMTRYKTRKSPMSKDNTGIIEEPEKRYKHGPDSTRYLLEMNPRHIIPAFVNKGRDVSDEPTCYMV